MEPLASVGELETHLQRTLDDQAGAEQALVLASGAVRAYCGWDLARATSDMEVYGDGSQVLTLPTLLLHNVLALSIDLVPVNPDPPVRNYDLMWTAKGQIFRAGGWRQGCVVNATVLHGYDPIPDLIKLVTLDLASRQIQNPEGLTSATVGQVSKTWTSQSTASPVMSTLHQSLLDRYRLF